MALRSLLRRIANPPVLLAPSGPLMGPVHGISPAATARFMKTGSQGEAETVAEQGDKSDKDFAQLEEAGRQHLAEFSRAVDQLRKVGNASAVVIAAIPLIMIFGSNYQA